MKSTVTDPWKSDRDESLEESEQTSDDPSLCFEDSFVPGQSYIHNESNSRLPDSAEYLASLENKLERLRSKRKSKDIMKSLKERNEASMMHFLSNNQSALSDDDFVLDTPVPSNYPIMRYVAPDKQALTMGELVELVKADQLAEVLDQEFSEEEKKFAESPN